MCACARGTAATRRAHTAGSAGATHDGRAHPRHHVAGAPPSITSPRVRVRVRGVWCTRASVCLTVPVHRLQRVVGLWMTLLCRRMDPAAHATVQEASMEAARVYRVLSRLTRRLPNYDLGSTTLYALTALNLVEATHPNESPECMF
jgi:hypothetical protein